MSIAIVRCLLLKTHQFYCYTLRHAKHELAKPSVILQQLRHKLMFEETFEVSCTWSLTLLFHSSIKSEASIVIDYTPCRPVPSFTTSRTLVYLELADDCSSWLESLATSLDFVQFCPVKAKERRNTGFLMKELLREIFPRGVAWRPAKMAPKKGGGE